MRDPIDQFPAHSEALANIFEIFARLQKTAADTRELIVAAHAIISKSKQLLLQVDNPGTTISSCQRVASLTPAMLSQRRSAFLEG
jgi:hypothetical protein